MSTRSTQDVLQYVSTVMLLTRPCGMCIEPVATMADPNDEIPGDYIARVSYQVPAPKTERADPTKLYCKILDFSFSIEKLKHCSETLFKRSIQQMGEDMLEFAYDEHDGMRHVLATESGFLNLGDIKRKAERGSA